MISISELWCGKPGRNHNLRYAKPKSVNEVRPVVVWNITKRCNLRCLHCYSNSANKQYESELSTHEALSLIEDLAMFQVPCLLFSGGEPFMRGDFFQLLKYADQLGLPTAISTNGTLIDANYATFLAETKTRYVGISIDGLNEAHDSFRGSFGAFERARNAFLHLNKNNIKCGLRLTLTKHNISNLPYIFKFIEDYSIKRICFYHLVPTGRGSQIKSLIPSKNEIRRALDLIISWTEDYCEKNPEAEVLTVDNHADNIYLYLKSKPPSPVISHSRESGNPGQSRELDPCFRRDDDTDPYKSNRILELIMANGGAKFSSGVGIACIDSRGEVHPDQFWTSCSLGTIRQRRFRDIWMDAGNEMLVKLRNRTNFITGRCSKCKWLDLCGGGLRSRADAQTGDAWASDPACYLSDDEIGV